MITLMIMASAHLFDVQILDHLIVDMDSEAYQSFADERIIEDTKHKVRGVMDPLSDKERELVLVISGSICQAT